MTRRAAGAIVLALSAAVLAVAPGASASTRECNGLQVCVPIAGPWVVVPTGGATRARVDYQLACPRGYIVGGLDAELSLREIDVSFAGALGSPVNPGITTSRAAVFSARYVGPDTRAAASIRPHIGCIPAAGGGGRVPTAASPVFPPGQPVTRRVRTVGLPAGASRTSQACAGGERLIEGGHAVGFFTDLPPASSLVRGIRTRQVVAGSRVVVVARAERAAAQSHAVLQVDAVCTGGK